MTAPLDGPLRKLRGMMSSGDAVLRIAQHVSEKYPFLTNSPYPVLNLEEKSKYKSMVAERNRLKADLAYMAALQRSSCNVQGDGGRGMVCRGV